MKLSLLMVTLTCLSSVESSDTELHQRAAAQLERLSAFRRTKELQKNDEIPRPKENNDLSENNQQEILMNSDAMKRVDELAEAAYGLYKNPNSDVMVQRIKRAEPILIAAGIGGSILSAIAAGLSGAVGVVPALSGGLSGGSRGIGGLGGLSGGRGQSAAQQLHDSYGVPIQPQGPPEYTLFDFKKAILNTIIQALKAIAGGGLGFGGSLIRGGGFLVQTKGRLISSAGDAISSLGSRIASSAVISSPKPVYGPPAYSYDAHHPQDTYDGPPPSPDATYTDNVYHHGPYESPSSDNPVNEPGLLIAKETKPELPSNPDEHHQENPPDHPIEPPQNAPSIDNNYAGPTGGSTTVTKLSGVVTGQFQPIHTQNQHQSPNDAYYQSQKEQLPIIEQQQVQEINNLPAPMYQPHQENNHNHQVNQQVNHQINHQVNYPVDHQVNNQVNHQVNYPVGHQVNHQVNHQINHPTDHQINHQEAFEQIQSLINPHLGISNQFNYQDNNNYANNYDIRQSEPLRVPIFDNQNSIDSMNLAVLGLPTSFGSPVYQMENGHYNTWKRSSGLTRRKKGSHWRYRVNDPKIFRI